ncbi:MAG: GtrA family protein [Chloroflexota bacterium]
MLRIIDSIFFFFARPVLRISSRLGMNQREMERFLKFLVVGTIGFILDFGILTLLYRGLGWPLIPSNVVSFSSAVISNFTWNRFWTYPDSRSKPMSDQLLSFFVVNIAGLGINTAILWLLEPVGRNWLGDFGYSFAKAIATIVVLFWNFFVNRYWTYSDVDSAEQVTYEDYDTDRS